MLEEVERAFQEIREEQEEFLRTHREQFEREYEPLMAQKNAIVKKFWEETEDPTTLEQIDALWQESIDRRETLVQEYWHTHEKPIRGRIMTPEVLAEEEIQKQLFFMYCKIKRQSSEEKNKK